MSTQIDIIDLDELVNQIDEIALTLMAVARSDDLVSPKVAAFLGCSLSDVVKALRAMIDGRAAGKEPRP